MKVIVSDKKRLAAALAEFKDSTAYKDRQVQTNFCGFARYLMGYLLKERPVWDTKDLTALIAVFKCPKNIDRFVGKRFEKNLDKLGFSTEIHNRLVDAFRVLQQKGEVVGYAGAGKGGIVGISLEDVSKVRVFLAELYKETSAAKVRAAAVRYSAEQIGQVTEGIYSPWAHYLQPEFCPILNSRSRRFLSDIGFHWENYAEVMDAFVALGKTFNLTDLGLLDEFIQNHPWYTTLTEIIRVGKD